MTDQELADKVASLNIGEPYLLPGSDNPVDCQTAEQYVCDWRVAGALIEKVLAEQPQKLDTVMVSYHPVIACFEASVAFGATNPYGTYLDRSDKESAPRAIIEACVAALSDD